MRCIEILMKLEATIKDDGLTLTWDVLKFENPEPGCGLIRD